MKPNHPYQSKRIVIYTGMLFFGIVSHALADNKINFDAAVNYALASSPQITASNAKAVMAATERLVNYKIADGANLKINGLSFS